MTGEKISLCAITYNHEGIIDRFIERFQSLVDEICIVRAIGNQKHDSTLRKAVARGCRVGEYFNRCTFDWQHVDDFSSARNQAWDMASHEWIMWADIDDVISEDSAKELRRLVTEAPADLEMIRCPYEVPDQHIHDNIRERLARRGKFKWFSPVHEYLIPTDNRNYRVVDTVDARITHSAKSNRIASCERNIRILEAVPDKDRAAGIYFYLFTEYYGVGRKADAVAAANKFLEMGGTSENECYEVFLILSTIAENPSHKAALLHEAHKTSPDRCEALYELTNLELTFGNIDRANAYCRQLRSLPKPMRVMWNYRRGFWSRFAEQLEDQVFRASGRANHADAREFNRWRAAGGKISLLHATRGRPLQATKARLTWLQNAKNPDGIEHIFAIDADDEESACLARFRHVVTAGNGGCVEAWNLAARMANGEILIQLSDDWIPPVGWDEEIIKRIGNTNAPKVIAMSDGNRKDNLLCMAILTRRRFLEQGFLFHPDFTGVYSDTWFSHCAYRDGIVIDAKDLVFQHCHPLFGTAENDATYARQNSEEAYAKGKEIYDRLLKIDSIHGWYNYSPLYAHVANAAPEGATIVEIGSWKGKSICDMALRLQSRKWSGRLIAVDTFRGENGQVEHADCGYFRPEFERNIQSCGVADMIEIIESDSAQAGSNFPEESIWFAYIDAAHDYDSVCKDIRAWWPRIAKGGILAGHDMQHWEVKNAVRDVLGDKAQDGNIIWTCKK